MMYQIHNLNDADRLALAEEFEVSLNTVERWAIGVSAPHPAIASRVERWCAARLSEEEPRP